MKRKFAALVVMLTLASALAVACSPSSPQDAEVNTDNFVGEWEFVYGSQEELSQETVQLAKSLGANAVMTLKEDGTGSFDLYGTIQNLTWSATSDTEGSLTLEDNEAASMKVEGGGLELADSAGQTLTFVRYVPSDDVVDPALVGEGADAASAGEGADAASAGGGADAETSGAAGASASETSEGADNTTANDASSSAE